MSAIPDFTNDELDIIKQTVAERFGEPKDIELADTEMRLDKSITQLTNCPAVYWEARDCHFVIVKTGGKRYRNQFFYRGYQQYGTGIEEYDDIFNCTLTLLQVQADHESQEKDPTQ
ncbi:MAG: hypothetical protein AMJ53_08435 [Gammaproteobacteria bacterium SG8_11]|nr:MAG: hypothetical protein AMJ53_08435 [Gammaproteobacteria bacterium SG8_11]